MSSFGAKLVARFAHASFLWGKNVILLNSWQHHSVFFEVFHLFGWHLNWMSYTCTTLTLHIQMCPLAVWLRSVCFDLAEFSPINTDAYFPAECVREQPRRELRE